MNPDKPKLYPIDDLVTAAKVDAILDQEADAFQGYRITRYHERFGFGFLKEEKYKEVVDAVVTQNNEVIIPRHLGFLEKQLKTNGSGWLAGTEGPSITDYFWVPVLRAALAGWLELKGRVLLITSGFL